MLFNSVSFLFFLPIVFLLYWYVFSKDLKLRNAFILVVSYVFYGWWDWRFLILIFISSLADYVIGLGFAQTEEKRKRKLLLYASLVVNIGMLCFFKYYNFFYDSLVEGLNASGMHLNYSTLKIILPVGISFYTFQTLSYSIDLYWKKIPVEKDPIAFFAFVSFFPQLVAGPIERAKDLLPQFKGIKPFDLETAKDGSRQILWGMFKKVVVSDTLYLYVDQAFARPDAYNGSYLLLISCYYAIIVYCDFSGYSEIAIGTAKLFGFKLRNNYAYPFFTRNFKELWRRCHMSLTAWFKDYVFIPMGGSKRGKLMTLINTTLVFTISGLWHGASWNYVAWGFFSGIAFFPTIFFKTAVYQNVIAHDRHMPTIKEVFQMILTFATFVFLFIFFYEQPVNRYWAFMDRLCSASLFSFPKEFHTWYFVLILLGLEWYNRRSDYGLTIAHWPKWLRWVTYLTLILLILGNYSEPKPFVYFQF